MTAPEARPGIVLVIDGIAIGIVTSLDIRGIPRGSVTVSDRGITTTGDLERPKVPTAPASDLAAAKRAAFGPRRARWA